MLAIDCLGIDLLIGEALASLNKTFFRLTHRSSAIEVLNRYLAEWINENLVYCVYTTGFTKAKGDRSQQWVK
jgi:hypothetical protein